MKCYQQLSQQERYIITACSISHLSKAETARRLGRSASTISRELARNRRTSDRRYRADEANEKAVARRKEARRGFRHSKEQWVVVMRLIAEKWSPEQICGILKVHGSFSISHQTIYKRITVDKQEGGELYKQLRIMPKARRKRYKSHDSRGILPGKRHISTRPAVVETRKQLGHWEGDTVIGADLHHSILTLVERTSGFAIIKKLSSRTTAEVIKAAISALREHEGKFKTITLDNGTEFHDYKTLEAHFPVQCYFATPYHSWERGSNENLNGLIRQYLPKGVSMRGVTQADCDQIAFKLNSRPRKRHGYKTPAEVYSAYSG
jgi:IS30 family transposase